MKNLAIILLALLLTACAPLATSTPEPAIEAPRLVQGQAMTSASFMARTASVECADKPLMYDNRAPGDPSFSIITYLEEEDFDRAQQWASFEVSRQYGCELARPGEWYWKLVAIELKCGPAVLQPRVTDDYGTPMSGILAFMNWPDAPPLPNGLTPDPPYFINALGAFTDGGGSVGWGFGPGSQLTPGQGGPFSVWISSDPVTWGDRRVGSDALLSVGWFENHCTFNGQFQQVQKAGEIPAPSGADYLGVFVDGVQIFYIPIVPGAPGDVGFSGLGLVGKDGVIWHVSGIAGEPAE